MNELALVEMEDLYDNPTPRVPVALCLDCSGSMYGAPIAELNEGVKTFYHAIDEDEIARFSAEICVVTFGPAQLAADYATLDVRPDPPILSASGNTPMGEAVKIALDSLDERKKMYKDSGVDYYQPWLVIMTNQTETPWSLTSKLLAFKAWSKLANSPSLPLVLARMPI